MGIDAACGCSKEKCKWLIQQKACPLTCLSKPYDVERATEEDHVPTVYYMISNLKLKGVVGPVAVALTRALD